MAQELRAWHCRCCCVGLIPGLGTFCMPQTWQKKKKERNRQGEFYVLLQEGRRNNFLKKERKHFRWRVPQLQIYFMVQFIFRRTVCWDQMDNFLIQVKTFYLGLEVWVRSQECSSQRVDIK